MDELDEVCGALRAKMKDAKTQDAFLASAKQAVDDKHVGAFQHRVQCLTFIMRGDADAQFRVIATHLLDDLETYVEESDGFPTTDDAAAFDRFPLGAMYSIIQTERNAYVKPHAGLGARAKPRPRGRRAPTPARAAKAAASGSMSESAESSLDARAAMASHDLREGHHEAMDRHAIRAAPRRDQRRERTKGKEASSASAPAARPRRVSRRAASV